MAKKLKEYYNIAYLEFISDKISKETTAFNKSWFFSHTKELIDTLEFNQRQELIAEALFKSIELGYKDTISIFYDILGPELKGNSGSFSEGWWLWPIGKYVELYGDDDFETSVKFSKELTKRFTSEYCMRPLIKKYPEQAFEMLKRWSLDENERVRRLSSECLRIRLPWAKKLYIALEYFEDYHEILSNLKDDKDKYIQKSVANNLNDLYKEDSQAFFKIVNSWEKSNLSDECKWIIKHGSRNIKSNL